MRYGIDTTEFEGKSGEVSRMIDQIFLDYSNEIDTNSNKELYVNLYQELSKENNLTQLNC